MSRAELEILHVQENVLNNLMSIDFGQTDDIESLLHSHLYTLGRALLKWLDPVDMRIHQVWNSGLRLGAKVKRLGTNAIGRFKRLAS